ncbi:QueT transporter family protein [Tepidibacter sp. Z1-5]|uniref:QueT transporter family protein n=1 Tax=Tepidibacter sp. Z1-5 TaxID=3134138 RepID=UPI0030BABFC8
MKLDSKKIAIIGIVAAIYAVATIAIAPISYGAIQFRISEILILLAFINPIYIPGLVLGCIIANFFSPLGMVDVVVGSTATLISVYLISKSKNLLIASLWPSIINGLIIGAELHYLFNLPYLSSAAYVLIGEFAVVTLLGYPVFKTILNKESFLKTLKLG